jgi:hypothetical protein
VYRQRFVGRDRRRGDRDHRRHAGPDDVFVPPSGRVRTARREAHPLGRTGIERFDGDILAHGGAGAAVTTASSNCGSVKPARGHLLSSSARAACSICTGIGRRGRGLREAHKIVRMTKNKGCLTESNH